MGSAAGRPVDSELRKYPAAGENVVRDDGVAVIVRCADAAQRLEKRIPGGGTVLESAGRLVEDGEAGVVPLHILSGTHTAVHVRGITGRREPKETHADALEGETRRTRCRGKRSRNGLERSLGSGTLRRELRRDRFGMINLRHACRIDRRHVPQIRASNRRDRPQIAHRAGIGAHGWLSCSWRSLCRVLVHLDRSTWLCGRHSPKGRCQPCEPPGYIGNLSFSISLLRAREGEQSEHHCREAQERYDKNPPVKERCAVDTFYFHG